MAASTTNALDAPCRQKDISLICTELFASKSVLIKGELLLYWDHSTLGFLQVIYIVHHIRVVFQDRCMVLQVLQERILLK